MSVERRAMLAYGWVIEDDELDDISEEVYEELVDRDIIIYQNEWCSGSSMIFALDYRLCIDEDAIIEINKPLCPRSEDLVNLFYKIFPNRISEEPKYLLCTVIS